MTNHIYLLATPAKADSISKVFQSVGRKYVQYSISPIQRSGTPWQRRQ
jgi:putative transposase